ncbi:MAG: hypothetical protein M3M85_00175 [bacterium]|nr:hypothetical protein [bacterium]
MDRTKLLKPIVFLMLFIFLLQKMAEKFFWYDSLRWFDIGMHLLGGFWVGIFFFWFFLAARLPFIRRPVRGMDRQTLGLALLFVLFVAISWEAGEFLTDNYIGQRAWGALDTISDIFLGLLGACVALFYCRRKIMTARQNNVQSS